MLALRRLIGCSLAVLALVMASCSQREQATTAEMAGKVTLDGKPFTTGSVVLVGMNGSTGADIKSDGSYHATNVPLGRVRVLVATTGSAPSWATTGSTGRSQPPQTPQTPTKYRSVDTSGLELYVFEGSNPFDIAMSSR
jgi:hypothetical protein